MIKTIKPYIDFILMLFRIYIRYIESFYMKRITSIGGYDIISNNKLTKFRLEIQTWFEYDVKKLTSFRPIELFLNDAYKFGIGKECETFLKEYLVREEIKKFVEG